MRETITQVLCDRCGHKGADHFSIPGGSRVDASGNNDRYDYVADLCLHCQGVMLSALLRDVPEVAIYLNKWTRGTSIGGPKLFQKD